MASLKERVQRLERTMDNEEPEQVFVIFYCDLPEDVNLSHEFDQWLTHEEVLAAVSGPPWARIAYADSAHERERRARVQTAEGQSN